MAQPKRRVNRASGPSTSSSDSPRVTVQVGAAKTSSSNTGDEEDTKGRASESAPIIAVGPGSGAASTMGSERETRTAGVERNRIRPESSCTRIIVLGEGRFEASAPQRNSGLTSP